MDFYLCRLGLDLIKACSVLGGSTPTFLSLDQPKYFLDFFSDGIDLSSCAQFNCDVDLVTSIEAEGLGRLQLMRSYGVSRVTIGVQLLNEVVLKKMNRCHE